MRNSHTRSTCTEVGVGGVGFGETSDGEMGSAAAAVAADDDVIAMARAKPRRIMDEYEYDDLAEGVEGAVVASALASVPMMVHGRSVAAANRQSSPLSGCAACADSSTDEGDVAANVDKDEEDEEEDDKDAENTMAVLS